MSVVLGREISAAIVFAAISASLVLAGAAIGMLSPGLAICLAVAAAIVAVPICAAALGVMSGGGTLEGSFILCLGALYGVVIHHSPDVSVLEIVLLGAVVVMLPGLHGLGLALGKEAPLRSFIFFTAGLLLLGLAYALVPPSGVPSGVPAKELAKNLEIFVFAGAVFAYAGTPRRLARVYALLVATCIGSIGQTLVSTHGHLLAGESLQTVAPLWIFVLSLPFIRRPPVALLALAGLVILVVSRTRGAWATLLVIALLVALDRRFGRSLDRRGRLILVFASLAVVVLIAFLPVLLTRVMSIASGNDQSTHDRTAMVQAALIALREHPLTGVGPGEFKPWLLNSPPVVQFRIGVEALPRDPHDVLAKFAAEMGVPGLLLMLGWMTSVVTPAWRVRRRVLAWGDLRPYGVGMVLCAVLLVVVLLTSEWATVLRLQIALAAGGLLALPRIAPTVETAGSGF